MAESDKPKDGRPESPTTARELDFDDDEPGSHPQTPAKATHDGAGVSSETPSKTTAATTTTSSNPTTATREASAPMSAREQAELTLREAFPSIDAGVVKAVLAASGGQVEPAFNALLGMSDPDAQTETEAPPPQQPPRPPPQSEKGGAKSQLEADELYARQLAEHYQQQDMRRAQREQGGGSGQRGYHRDEEAERERNFIDDDLPEIGENIRKGFIETQQKFNGWLNNLKKKIDGDDEDEDERPALPARRGPEPGASSNSRRSNDYDRYDADPEEFDSDFSKLQLRDATASPTSQPARPGANPNLFKPTPALPSDGRKVSFQEGPPEEIRGTPDPTKRPSSTTNKSKWQPLAAADPTPVSDHDPFTVGDSDDDDAKKKEDKTDESEKLKKAMAEAAGDDISSDNKLGPAETSGPNKTKDKVAEDKATGKS